MLFPSTYLSAALALLNDGYYNNAATDVGWTPWVGQLRLILTHLTFLEVACYKPFTVNKLLLSTNYVLMALDLLENVVLFSTCVNQARFLQIDSAV